MLCVAAIVLGLAGPLLSVTGTVPAHPHPAVAAVGFVLALTGFAATLAGQTGMGASWRSGVDATEPTSAGALITLIAGAELRVRAVEEPCWRHAHGDAYATYAARTGRFVPHLGRSPVPVAAASRTLG